MEVSGDLLMITNKMLLNLCSKEAVVPTPRFPVTREALACSEDNFMFHSFSRAVAVVKVLCYKSEGPGSIPVGVIGIFY